MSSRDFAKNVEVIHRLDDGKPWNEIRYTGTGDLASLLDFANTITNQPRLNQYRQPFLFRGQSRSEWKLKPKIFRHLEGLKEDSALRIEFDSMNYFRQRAKQHLNHIYITDIREAIDILELMGVMQHYNAPTRMLDWTTSFYIALYFAVLNDKDADGAVWFFFKNPLIAYMEEKYGVMSESELENLENLLDDENDYVEFGLNAKPVIDTYDMRTKTERMTAQHCIFTCSYKIFSDHAFEIGNALRAKSSLPIEFLTKFIIPKNVKDEILAQLQKINITSATLFPGIDGLGREISEIIQIERHRWS
jgi:hypothetical protein